MSGEHTEVPSLKITSSSWKATLLLALSDILVLTICGTSTVYVRWHLQGQFTPSLYWNLWPILALFVASYAFIGLYPGIPSTPVQELRKLTIATTLVYLTIGASTFLLRGAENYSRSIFLVAWMLSLVFLPLARGGVRTMFARKEWWGHPTLVLGAGRAGSLVVQSLKRQPWIGLKPVLVLDDDPNKTEPLHGVPLGGRLELAPSIARAYPIPYVIVSIPSASKARHMEIIQSYCELFPHIILIPDLFEFSTLWVTAQDLGGLLGLRVCQRLLLPRYRMVKRLLDLTLAIFGGILILPIIAVFCVLIKLDSAGPCFYGQQRIGRGGRRFKAWKFRSMIKNADQVLQTFLEQNPEMKAEWERDQKLKKDPRITRMGHLLRKTSLDELPQLWNVIKGEMSLVGPRPIVQDEIARYGEKFDLYLKVMSGMTGLWQISGRSETTYDERVRLDAYYVRNWSIWLDLYILAHTIRVVLLGRGAY